MVLCFVMLVEDVHRVYQVLLNSFNSSIKALDEDVHRDLDLLHRLGHRVHHLRRGGGTPAILLIELCVSLKEVFLELGVCFLEGA